MNSTRPIVIARGSHEAVLSGYLPTERLGGSVTFAAGRLEDATMTGAAVATTFDQVPALTVPGPFRRAAVVVGDLLGAMAIVLCIPFAILAIGIPIVLCVRLLLWIGGLL